MQFLICPFGTAGDVYPFIAIGQGLRRRGHDVCIIGHSLFGGAVRRFGLEFDDLNDLVDYRETHDHPDIWHPMRGPIRGNKFILRSVMRQQFAAIERRHVPGETILVAPGASFGARIAHDKFGIPLATGFTCPFFLRSAIRPPIYPIANPPWLLPSWGKRAWFEVIVKLFADPLIKPEINRFRAELGLPPVESVLGNWYVSDQRILGLFPEWFGMAPPDWPPQLKMTGFPMFDAKESNAVPPDVDAFLEEGEPPVVCTPGTGMANARPFFDACLDGCRRLNRRAIFLTRFAEQLPPSLPPTVLHSAYLPFSQVFPRAAALVFHGGMGTLAQALVAGLPQLVMPMTYDQPDNADRLRTLGVGRSLKPKDFTGPNVARELGVLLTDSAVTSRARDLASRFPPGDPVSLACDELEALGRTTPATVAA